MGEMKEEKTRKENKMDTGMTKDDFKTNKIVDLYFRNENVWKKAIIRVRYKNFCRISSQPYGLFFNCQQPYRTIRKIT